MGSTYAQCPFCETKTRHLLEHIKTAHPRQWQLQVNAAKDAFNDLSFGRKSDYAARGLMLDDNDLRKIWRSLYTPAQIKARGNAARRVNCAIKGKAFYNACTGTKKEQFFTGDVSRCPVCGRPVSRLITHMQAMAYAERDPEHMAVFADKVEEALTLFSAWDVDLNEVTEYGNRFCRDVWVAVLGKKAYARRVNAVNGVNVGKALTGRVLSPEVRAILSAAHANSKRHGFYNSVSGYRHDLGHSAASTYEANVYRVLQYHGAVDNVDYFREYHNIFPLEYNGRKFNYRVDFHDIKGVFGIPGAYVEVKGYMDDGSAENILAFREKFGENSILVIGKQREIAKKHPEVRVDIDYDELTAKYMQLIPLWEGKKQNLRSTPWLYTRPDDETADEN